MRQNTEHMPGYPPPYNGKDDGIAALLAIIWMFIFFLMLLAMFELIQPGVGGFAANFKRLLTASAIAVGGFAATRIATKRGAPLAAEGSMLALAASIATYLLVSPLVIVIGYLALSAPEIARLDARERCAEIRKVVTAYDQFVLNQIRIGKPLRGNTDDAVNRARGERTKGTESGIRSTPGRPEPVTALYQESARRLSKVADLVGKDDSERTSKSRDLLALADDCEATIANARKWSKDGPTVVLAIYDKAGAALRELGQASPATSMKSLVDELRALSAPRVEDSEPLANARRVVRGYADALDKDLATLPKAPEGLPPAAPAPLLVSAFEPDKFAALWPNFAIATLTDGCSILVWIFAFVLHRRRLQTGSSSPTYDGDVSGISRANTRGRA